MSVKLFDVGWATVRRLGMPEEPVYEADPASVSLMVLVERPGVTLYGGGQAPQQQEAGPCPDCKGRGTIQLFMSVVECGCGGGK